MLYFKLNQPINSNKLLHDIQQLISKNQITDSSFLKIDIVHVSYDINMALPKLENCSSDS
jgi:hypothetical protein